MEHGSFSWPSYTALLALLRSQILPFSCSLTGQGVVRAFPATMNLFPDLPGRPLLPILLATVAVLLTTGPDKTYAQQRPTLRLFADGATEETFFAPVGAGVFSTSLITNPDTVNLVIDSEGELDHVDVELNGASDDAEVERVEVSLPGVIVQQDAPQFYSYRLEAGLATAGNFSSLLATLTYVSNLTADSLTQPPRNFTVTAYDDVGAGAPVIGHIVLLELNAEGPQFEFPAGENIYTATVDEASLPGTLVTSQISAPDPGGDSVTYSFGNPVDAFQIDPLTGVVRVNNSNSNVLDHESTTDIILSIVATDDHPINSLSSTAILTVTINDINDNSPMFTQVLYVFEVFEEEVNAEVGAVTAIDLDDVGTLHYDFVDPITQQFFVINGDTGDIIVRTTLDYEDAMFGDSDPRVLIFLVQVDDGISFNFTTVQVNIRDLPDNRPVIRPTEKLIILDLDMSETSAFLTSGSGGNLSVTDDSNFEANAFLVGGVATYSVLQEEQVSHAGLWVARDQCKQLGASIIHSHEQERIKKGGGGGSM